MVTGGAIAVWGAAVAGRRPALGVLGPGDAFGLETFASLPSREEPVGGRSLALLASRVLLVPAHAATEQLASNREVARAFFDVLVEQAHRMERRLVRALAMPLSERLFEELRELAAAFGRAVPGGRRIALPLTQDLLADLTGTARESVNRALRELTARGMIRRSGRTYVVAEPLPAEAERSCGALP